MPFLGTSDASGTLFTVVYCTSGTLYKCSLHLQLAGVGCHLTSAGGDNGPKLVDRFRVMSDASAGKLCSNTPSSICNVRYILLPLHVIHLSAKTRLKSQLKIL